MTTVPTQVIDKNGRQTTVHKSVGKTSANQRIPAPRKESVTAIHRRLSDSDDASMSGIRSYFKDFSTPEGSSNFCEGASIDLVEMIGGEMIRVTGLVEEPTRNPNSASQSAIEHHAVLKNGYVYDVTARQFEPDADFPEIVPAEEFFAKWDQIEVYGKDDDGEEGWNSLSDEL